MFTTIRVHRIGRWPDPWQYPDWSHAGPDGTFGNRFDDPTGTYRVLYASSVRLGCFLETLARYRPDLSLYAELQEIAGEDDQVPPGIVPQAWLRERMLSTGVVRGNYADIAASEWIALLRRDLASILIDHGITDFTVSELYLSAPRIVTQHVSLVAYVKNFNGIRYFSKYGHDIENWALFEPVEFIERAANSRIEPDDPDLLEALRLFDLKVG